jgi:hypothetical protein
VTGDAAWHDLLERPVVDAQGVLRYPGKESAREALDSLQAAYANEYVFATPPHELAECPFAGGEMVAMLSVPHDQRAGSNIK